MFASRAASKLLLAAMVSKGVARARGTQIQCGFHASLRNDRVAILTGYSDSVFYTLCSQIWRKKLTPLRSVWVGCRAAASCDRGAAHPRYDCRRAAAALLLNRFAGFDGLGGGRSSATVHSIYALRLQMRILFRPMFLRALGRRHVRWGVQTGVSQRHREQPIRGI